MSALTQTLEITPKRRMLKESLTAVGFRCPVCNGKGEHYIEVGHDQYETEYCPYCHGTGHVKAVITIDWIPETTDQQNAIH